MNVTGVVEQVGTKPVNTRFGTKNTYSARVNGQWYKFGFKDPKISVGDNVSVEYTPGKYGNEVSTCTLVAAAAAPAPANDAAVPAPRPAYTGGGKGSFPIGPLDGQRSIVRQNALTNARELVVGTITAANNKHMDYTKLNDEQIADRIIALAKRFEAYTTGDMDMEAAVASIEDEQKAA